MASKSTRSASRSTTKKPATPTAPTAPTETETPEATAPTETPVATAPTAPTVPEAGAADGADGAEATPPATPETAETPDPETPEPPAPVDPIDALRAEREKLRVEVAAAKNAMKTALAADDDAGLATAIAEHSTLKGKIDGMTVDIREDGYASLAFPMIVAALTAIPTEDLSTGSQSFRIDTIDGVPVKLTRITTAAPAKRKSGKVAALRGSGYDRNPRLPPSGVTLPSAGGANRGACTVTYSDDNSVRVSGPCHDGTILDGAIFSSVSAAGKTVTGNPVNGYTWSGLGGKWLGTRTPEGEKIARAWSGEQVW